MLGAAGTVQGVVRNAIQPEEPEYMGNKAQVGRYSALTPDSLSNLLRTLGSCWKRPLFCGAIFATTGILPLLAQVSVTTSSNDTQRTGQNLNETVLTLSNVNSIQFGKVFSQTVDGYVYAQPLYLPNVTIGGYAHNVVFVATEHDSVYAFDADSNAGSDASPLWVASLLTGAHGAASGATTVPSSLLSTDISPEVGITGTPVIDPETGTLYVVSKTMEGSQFVQRLHALDVTSGAEKFGGPVVILPTVAGTGNGSVSGQLTFDSEWENQRPGLLLLNGVVYVGFAAHGDNGPWHGWILGFSASTLKPTGVYCASPNGGGSGIWMTGVGLAAEVIDPVNHPFGRMFVPTGNGDYNATAPYTDAMDYGDSILDLDLTNGVPTVQDEFTPYNQATLDFSDGDLGAGGIVILPTQTTGSYPHLLVQAGKSGEAYLLNRENLGGYHTGGDQVVQGLPGSVGGTGSWSTPAYWNGTVYYAAQNDNLKAFPLVSGKLTGPTAKSSEYYGYPGANPSISANGTSQGIVWSVNTSQYGSGGAAVLTAHSAANVATTLYSSASNPARDGAGPAVKFVVPTVANGKVYIGTQYQLDVYGLIGAQATTATPALSPGTENFSGTLSVSMNDATSGAAIYYTTNGAAPTASSTLYTGPVTITATTTLNAIAIAPGFAASPMETATYTSTAVPPPAGISYPVGFAASQGTMILNGSTDLDDSRLQLTNGGSFEAGSAWYWKPVNIQSFSTTFTFQLSNPVADGMTFTIQGQGLSALGLDGGGLGFQTIPESVAVKFDLHNNAGEGTDSTGLYTGGASPTMPAINLSTTGINLHSDDTMQVTLTYSGTTLSMTIADVVTGATYSTSWTVNIPALVGGNTAYVGFTGGTGGSSSSQKVLTWAFTPGAAATPVLAAPTFSPVAGSYSTAQTVTIADATAGASIYYTTNGGTPGTSTTLYRGPITVSATETLQAIAVDSGYTNSAVASAGYTINAAGTTLINYPSGQFSAVSFSLNGGSTITSAGALQVTDGGDAESRSAWYGTEVPVAKFTTDFTFQQLSAAADGMTFTLQAQSATATGKDGGGLGYQSIPASVAIKFDLHSNAGEGLDSTGIYTGGAAPTVPAVNLSATPINLHSGDVMHAHLVYDGTNLTMTLTDTVTMGSVVEVFPIDIPAAVGGSKAWAGFTGGTGSTTSVQNVLSWTYVSN